MRDVVELLTRDNCGEESLDLEFRRHLWAKGARLRLDHHHSMWLRLHSGEQLQAKPTKPLCSPCLVFSTRLGGASMPRLKWGSQRRATPRHDCASGHPHTSLQPQRNSPVLDESLPDNDDKIAAVLLADDAQSRAARSSDSDEAFKVKYEAAASLSEDADRAGAAFPKADKLAAAMLLPADNSACAVKSEDCDEAAVFSSKVKDEAAASLCKDKVQAGALLAYSDEAATASSKTEDRFPGSLAARDSTRTTMSVSTILPVPREARSGNQPRSASTSTIATAHAGSAARKRLRTPSAANRRLGCARRAAMDDIPIHSYGCLGVVCLISRLAVSISRPG